MKNFKYLFAFCTSLILALSCNKDIFDDINSKELELKNKVSKDVACDYYKRFVFPESNLEKMLNKNQVSEREKFRTIYEFHLKKTYRFIRENNFPFIDVNYNELMSSPEVEIEKVMKFSAIENSIESVQERVSVGDARQLKYEDNPE